MTHLDVYRCDRARCKAEEPAEYIGMGEEQREATYPPAGWVSLDRRAYGGSKHFCSLDCLAIWARAERAAVEAL